MTLLVFLKAFLACGVACVVAQALLLFTRCEPPHILNIYLGIGGLLTPCGLMAWLSQQGGGGFLAVICGAGNAFATAAAQAASGSALMLVVVTLLFAVTIVLGLISGELRYRLEGKQQSPQ